MPILEKTAVTYYYRVQYAALYLSFSTSRPGWKDLHKEGHVRFFMLVTCTVLLCMPLGAHAEDGKITAMAREAGFTSCLSTVARLERFLSSKRNYGSWSFWSNRDTDKQPFNASMEISFSDGSILIDFTVIPSPDGTCAYTYTKSWYTPTSCDETVKQRFMQKAKFKGRLNSHVMAYTLGSAEVMLQNAGSGCMVQKKEIGFQFSKQDKQQNQ